MLEALTVSSVFNTFVSYFLMGCRLSMICISISIATCPISKAGCRTLERGG
jgi:hypothetical protein